MEWCSTTSVVVNRRLRYKCTTIMNNECKYDYVLTQIWMTSSVTKRCTKIGQCCGRIQSHLLLTSSTEYTSYCSKRTLSQSHSRKTHTRLPRITTDHTRTYVRLVFANDKWQWAILRISVAVRVARWRHCLGFVEQEFSCFLKSDRVHEW